MVRNTNTQRAILDLAESFLQEKGFNGFSYAHIAAELGVKNAAIHYHFPSKEALACAVIQRYRDRFQLWINNSRIKNLSPQEKLDWFFSIYTNTRADNGKVCLAGSLETEFNSLPAALREQTEALTRELLGWLQTTLDEGREADVFHFSGNPASKAALILASLQGALQMARALGTGKFHAVVEQHKEDLLSLA
ncbi:MAG TPA: TetR/AcrR family transcriptional regulator [Anaerolineales bacterium]|nr:TetR/AcrR family transcriptional regulator [Anaerolineales bacterium]